MVSHPNVFHKRLCINLLNTEDGYTPAYTMKGICIQLLSFFSSDHVQQMWGKHGGLVDRKQWRSEGLNGFGQVAPNDIYRCDKYSFGKAAEVATGADVLNSTDADPGMSDANPDISICLQKNEQIQLKHLPIDVLLMICDYLDDTSLLLACEAGGYLAVKGDLTHKYNTIRTRQLVCFVLKTGFHDSDLGIGVHIAGRNIESEFDLIPYTAFNDDHVRRSIHGLPFELWLPVPLAQKYWERIKVQANLALHAIAKRIGISGGVEHTLYNFMNGVVVRLSTASDEHQNSSARSTRAISSSLTHASDKAIESSFQLFHLLLCLAVDFPSLARDANELIHDFISGHRSKDRCPNIGHLLIAILIVEVEVTEELVKAIITESVTRNVVWMLEAQPRGSGMPELSFLETSTISMYRLRKTYETGKTSYKLLMFLNLMRIVVRNARNNQQGEKMTLEQLRDHLFELHGAPPADAAAHIACQIRDIQKVNGFPAFLANMGMRPVTASSFTSFLRRTVEESIRLGYSKAGLTQAQALQIRMVRDNSVQAPQGMQPQSLSQFKLRQITFFP